MDSFRLQNIKSFKDTGTIDLKPITVFVGKNSSGKSSLVRFPVVIAQTFMEDTISPIIFNGKYVDYGNFEDVVHQHEGNEVSFSIGIDSQLVFYSGFGELNKQRKILLFNEQKDNVINISLKKSLLGNKIILQKTSYYRANEKVFELEKNNEGYKLIISQSLTNDGWVLLEQPCVISLEASQIYFNRFTFSINELNKNNSFIQGGKNYIDTNFQPQKWDNKKWSMFFKRVGKSNLDLNSIEAFFKKNHFTKEETKLGLLLENILTTLQFVDNIAFGVRGYLSVFINNIHYIGPFRTNPQRTYRDSESLKNYVGKDGQDTSMILKQALRENPGLFTEINDWMQSALGYSIGIEEIPQSNLFRIKIYNENNTKGDNLIDVGYGISQILPIVTQLYYKEEQRSRGVNPFFILEQPEIHLHPKAQAELANLFVEKIRDKKTKILIETHSEHLIRRLQSLVADPENDFNADDVAIYYVDMEVQGESTIKRMEITETGQFKERWPSGFFDKAYQLSKELLRNASKRASL